MSCAPSPFAICSALVASCCRRRSIHGGWSLLDDRFPFGVTIDRARRRRRVGVEGELVGGEVRPRVVEDVSIAGRGGEHDDHCDEDADADRRERRARTRPVAGEVAKRQSGRDRRAPGQPRGEREEERREQDEPGDEQHDPEHQLWHAATPVSHCPCFPSSRGAGTPRRGRRCRGSPSGGSGGAGRGDPRALRRSAPG